MPSLNLSDKETLAAKHALGTSTFESDEVVLTKKAGQPRITVSGKDHESAGNMGESVGLTFALGLLGVPHVAEIAIEGAKTAGEFADNNRRSEIIVEPNLSPSGQIDPSKSYLPGYMAASMIQDEKERLENAQRNRTQMLRGAGVVNAQRLGMRQRAQAQMTMSASFGGESHKPQEEMKLSGIKKSIVPTISRRP